MKEVERERDTHTYNNNNNNIMEMSNTNMLTKLFINLCAAYVTECEQRKSTVMLQR